MTQILFRSTLKIGFFCLLTILTQIGGLLWCLFYWAPGYFFGSKSQKISKMDRFALWFFFYLISTKWIIPPLANLNGRQPLPLSGSIQPVCKLTFWLNRNYVSNDLFATIEHAASILEKSKPNCNLLYMDACFPFFNGFPLFPHLSHNDGKKIDLAFVYFDKSNHQLKPPGLGYGNYTRINKQGEIEIEKCKTLNPRYDFAKWLIPPWQSRNQDISVNKTKDMIQILTRQKSIKKIFIEPYLSEIMGLSDEQKIRFHGCYSVRHDDHIHIEVK